MNDLKDAVVCKITLRKILYDSRVTDNMRMFLIDCLKFEWTDRNGVEDLLNHPWLEAEGKKYNSHECLVSVGELVKSQVNFEKAESN